MAEEFGGVVQEDVAIGAGRINFPAEGRGNLPCVLQHVARTGDDGLGFG
jgi:hypothetical protein